MTHHLWRFANRIATVILNPNHLKGAMARIPALEPPFTPDVAAQLAILLCGWYHTICFAARTARVDLEPGAPRFADITAA